MDCNYVFQSKNVCKMLIRNIKTGVYRDRTVGKTNYSIITRKSRPFFVYPDNSYAALVQTNYARTSIDLADARRNRVREKTTVDDQIVYTSRYFFSELRHKVRSPKVEECITDSSRRVYLLNHNDNKKKEKDYNDGVFQEAG